ncbi:MAG: hypothetical protein ACRCT8_04200, partial [Lacipirellulaceae bacterium]
MISGHDSQFDSLLARMVDGVITPEEARRLGALLRGNPERQQLYSNYLLAHILLEREGVLRAEADFELGSRQPTPQPLGADVQRAASPVQRANVRPHRAGRRGVRYALAAVVLLAAGVAVLSAVHRDSNSGLATVVDSIGVEGAPHELTTEGAVLDIGLPL